GLPATPYLDPITKYTFLGIRDLSGFIFGIMMPPLPTTNTPTVATHDDASNANDAIIQIISPLNIEATGWGGIVFGPQMIGSLIIVVWPSNGVGGDGKRKVLISPRIAIGNSGPDMVKFYTSTPLTFRKIDQGTFVNDTHVGATFICGGCVGAEKSFRFSDDGKGKAVFSFAYSAMPIMENSGPRDSGRYAVITDHRSRGERFGDFDVDLGKARNDDYGKLAGLAEGAALPGVGTTSLGSGKTTT
ncbi:hypothetical protein V8F20_011955, partial [Naviculisporaceae sp. PSN 640]